MPKRTRDFPDHFHFMCTVELRQIYVALSYLRGDNGHYAAVARDALTRAAEQNVKDLPEDKRKVYDDILATVKARELVAEHKQKPPP